MVENYLKCSCLYHQHEWDRVLPTAEFAYSSAVSEGLGVALIEIYPMWQPETLLDVISDKDVAVQSVKDFKEKLKSSLDGAQFSYELPRQYRPQTHLAGRSLLHTRLAQDFKSTNIFQRCLFEVSRIG